MITILNRRARTEASSSAGYMSGLTRRDLMAARPSAFSPARRVSPVLLRRKAS